jgi:putative Holliday junction resolvase
MAILTNFVYNAIMKYLGIDYGSKRIGLAVSDENADFAFPLSVLPNSEKSVEKILEICREKNIGAIVVGRSENFQMEENEIMKEINPFAEKLKKESDLPISFHPEFLTSQEAKREQGKNNMLDASAAAIILKHFLEIRRSAAEIDIR